MPTTIALKNHLRKGAGHALAPRITIKGRNIFIPLVLLISFGFSLYLSLTYLNDRGYSHRPRHDSLNYLLDATILRYHLFNHGTSGKEWVAEQFKGIHYAWAVRKVESTKTLPVYFPSRLYLLIQNTILLELFDNNYRVVYFFNALYFSLSVAIISYIIASEFGLFVLLYLGSISLLNLEYLQISTMMLEPLSALTICVLALGLWMAIRGKKSGYVLVFVLALISPFIKNTMTVICGISGLALLVQLGLTKIHIWPKIARISILVILGIISILGVKTGVGYILTKHQSINSDHLHRSNTAYGLWMGSLPTKWTGAYLGRATVGTFRTMVSKPDFPQKYHYFSSFKNVGGHIVSNYINYPLDALKRLAFKYQFFFNQPRRYLVEWSGFGLLLGSLFVLGSAFLLFTYKTSMWPLIFITNGTIAMHMLSRLRLRDVAQVDHLILALATIGIAYPFFLLINRKDHFRPKRSKLAIALCALAVFSGPTLVLTHPAVADLSPPRLTSAQITDMPESGQVRLTAKVSESHIFGRVKSRCTTGVVLSQATEDGVMEFLIKPKPGTNPNKNCPLILNIWGINNQEIVYAINHKGFTRIY